MKNNDLQRLHETLIEILDYVVSICDENNLSYVLAFGTALGAYRHKGFIPWDDDLDIALPREDYEKFLDIMLNSEDKRYMIQYEKNEEKYYLPFAKVRKNGTIFAESIAKGMYENNGIFIDIFPLDYVKDANTISYKVKSYVLTYLKHILRYSSFKGVYKDKRGVFGHIAEHIICIPAYIIPKKLLLNKLNKWSKGKCSFEEANYIGQYSYRRSKMTMPKDYYFPPKKLNMCGKEYYAPNEIEKYLSTLYGDDFMQLPPIEQRRTHLPEVLRFE